jgi:hypothetical protein
MPVGNKTISDFWLQLSQWDYQSVLKQIQSLSRKMYLNDWGTGAKSEIKGTPVNFYLWIAQQIGSAISKGMSEKK